MFDDDFLTSLSDDSTEGALQIYNQIVAFHHKVGESLDNYQGYLEAYALISSYFELNGINYSLPKFGPDNNKNMQDLVGSAANIGNSLKHKLDTLSVDELKEKYQARLKGGFCYEFTEGDLQRIQALITELRSEISGFEGFENNHRQRLLKRLEKLQSELHKKVSDLDRFWGLIGDAGVVIGKFGKDAKPMVDRIKEIADIIWRTQSRTEELPSGTKPPLISNDIE